MSLRNRILAVLLALVVIYAALDVGIQQWIVLPSFVALEREEARQDMHRCIEALRRELYHLDMFCFDWAAWDDTYEYVVNPKPTYEEANLAPATFTDNNLNLLYIVNASGRVVWGRIYDLETEEPIQMPDFPSKTWALTHPLLNHTAEDTSIMGVVLTSRGPMLVSSCPILTTSNGGPSRGALVMGRFLDEGLVEALAEHTCLTIRVEPIQNGLLPEGDPGIPCEPATHGACRFALMGNTVLQVASTFPGIDGRPALRLRVEVPRDIMAQGRAAMRFARQSLIVAALIIALVVLILMRKTVVEPITQLTEHVTEVSASGKLDLLPSPSQAGEIGALTREFNRMVRRLESENAERRHAEQSLRESEARLRAIVETAPDAIVTVDDGGDIESLNPTGAKLFGYEPDDLLGREIGVLMPETFAARPPGAADGWVAFARDRLAARGREGTGRRKDGGTFPVHVSASEVLIREHPHLSMIVRDITELNEMHDRVLRAEHLATLGEMGASLAHDIRNPLTAISAAAQVLYEGFAKDDPQREIMQEMIEYAGRIEAIIKQLLAYAKPWEPSKAAVDLRTIIQKVSDEAASRDRWAHVRFVFEGEPTLTANVDPALVEQVLWNLLENTADAMGDTGEVHWRFAQTDDTVRITMKDTGPGMPADIQDKLFRPFFTTKTNGIGLGLPTCRRIMDAHGGSIRVAGKPKHGTVITLEFPKGD